MREGSCRAATVHPGNIKIATCVPCVPQLEKHWECEVPNLLPGSAAAVRSEFGDVIRSTPSLGAPEGQETREGAWGKAACP